LIKSSFVAKIACFFLKNASKNVSKDVSEDVLKDVCETYRNLAKLTAQIALKKGTIDKEKYIELLEVLK